MTKIETHGESHEIQDAPLTFVYGTPVLNINVPDAQEIGVAQTLAVASKLAPVWLDVRDSLAPDLKILWGDDYELPDALDGESNGFLHTVGLVACMQYARANGVRIFLRQPEAFLHPRIQLQLADLLIKYTK